MKKIIICLMTLLFSVSALMHAQTSSGSWDSGTATYSNTKHNITWKLLSELTWVGRPILTESTLLKVKNNETQILIKLGASRLDGPEADIWDYISQYNSKVYKELLKAQAEKNGMTFKGISATKSQLCGIHAAKVKTDMSKYSSEQNTTIHSIEYTYHLCKNNYVYSISVTGLSVLEEDLAFFDRVATKLFNGFTIK